MNLDLPPNAAWAANAIDPKKKKASSFSSSILPPPPPPPPTIPPPPKPPIAAPKRNSGMAFTMVPGLASQPSTSSPVPPAPRPASAAAPIASVPPPPPPAVVAAPKRNSGMAFKMAPGGLTSQPSTSAPVPAPGGRTSTRAISIASRKWIGIGPPITWRIFVGFFRYPYPWLLTAWHALCSSLGTYVSRRLNAAHSEHRCHEKNHYILMFSILYTVNIAVSNVALGLTTIPDHQTIRSSIPFFILLLNLLLYHHLPTPLTILTLLPLTLGILLASASSSTLTPAPLALTLLSSLLSALKTLITHSLQTSPSLCIPPLALLHSIAPLAGIQATIWSYMNGEIDEFLVKQIFARTSTSTSTSTLTSTLTPKSTPLLFHLLLNGLTAFLLNYSSLTTNKKTSALSMAVLGNIKQALSIGASVLLFRHGYTGFTHIFGVLLALGGGFLYSVIEVRALGNGNAHLKEKGRISSA
ncbi:hypothetical protein SBOR_8564 [Sclerotinia borealis F-4128]|uniref:Sugar phosphate transporter domain-containing protein n=1 Tax=Sclerotinia borealis (strain F-4128) TaxID=1432307 RepID=W9C8Z4_SCLBF|nr:hypothetical protein SBOR_8564 [Sclerotinia borealis F-4128]